MNKKEIDELIEQYFKWLKDKTITRNINNTWTEITTPYLDRHNDYLQIYAKKEKDEILLTDDGYIINDLEMSGCSLDTPRRKDMLLTTLNGFGVQIQDNCLFVKANVNTFPEKKHELIQAMLSINDLFYLSAPYVQNLFLEDVINWFDKCDIRYTPDVRFVGKTGFNYKFDCSIPKSKNSPERIIQTLSTANRENATNLVFKWVDTKDRRPLGSTLVAVLNDSEKNISDSINEAFKNYDIKMINWSQKEDSLSYLAS